MTCLERTVSVRRGEWNQKHFYIFLIFLFGNSESDAFLPPVFPHKSKASTTPSQTAKFYFLFYLVARNLSLSPRRKRYDLSLFPSFPFRRNFSKANRGIVFATALRPLQKFPSLPFPSSVKSIKRHQDIWKIILPARVKLLGNRVGKNFSNAYITFNPNPARRNFHVATFLPSRITA